MLPNNSQAQQNMPPPRPQSPPMQPKGQNLTMPPNDAKVALGIITNLQKYQLPQKGTTPQSATQPNSQPAQDPTQGVPTNQSNPGDVQAQMQGLESRLMDELQTLKAEMKTQGDGAKELADLKLQIQQILQSND